ncbi:uncharacterized protein LOC34617770 [Cyclospora cayetanensis]|uniref:Uncharacterized protein n=2 Tax=Cyclospora cayetanensis TaxID=88456 RepID=A0A1D3CTJ7_9EIME|nr:uncharacterized protein LOC34617770 [Cyclospora cayetanensis]OEH74518.1 hypothetical protein cyc_00630 [Cyclospora cayetanensis]
MTEDRLVSVRCSSTGFAAKVQDLVAACQAATDAKILLENCENLFRLLRDKKIELKAPFLASCAAAASAGGDGHQKGFLQWLQQSYQVFISIVFELLASSEPHVQRLGLAYLFRIVKHESEVHKSAVFPLSAFQFLVARLLQSDGFSDYVQELLVEEYVTRYLDIRYYLLVVTGKILREFVNRKLDTNRNIAARTLQQRHRASGSDSDEATDEVEPPSVNESSHDNAASSQGCEWFVWTKGEAELSKRMTSLLLRLSKCLSDADQMVSLRGKRKAGGPPPASRSSDTDTEVEEEVKAPYSDDEKAASSHSKTFIEGLGSSKALEMSNHRLAYQNTWLSLLLNVEHDTSTTQRLLVRVPRTVFPFLSNPLLLADFYLKAFNEANRISIRISALSGLFYLLTKHRLGNPDVLESTQGSAPVPALDETESAGAAGAHFYQRLFRLITPAAFAPRLRVRFLRLLNMALRSDLLPTCLVAAFIKKCSRVACLVPPPATLCLEALVLSLLQKYHTTCKPLLSVPESVSSQLRVQGDSFDYSTLVVRQQGGQKAGHPSFSSDEDEVQKKVSEGTPVLELVSRAVPKIMQISKEEIQPLTRKEARMSLWEVDILRKHSLKSVQQLAELFAADFINPSAKKVALDDFLDLTTGSLLAREFKALNKSTATPVPLAYTSVSAVPPCGAGPGGPPPDVPQLYAACMNLAKQKCEL